MTPSARGRARKASGEEGRRRRYGGEYRQGGPTKHHASAAGRSQAVILQYAQRRNPTMDLPPATLPGCSRRGFLRTAVGGAAALTAASYAKVLGAQEKIRLGVIGCGDRG